MLRFTGEGAQIRGRSDSPGSVDLCRAAKDSVERSFQAELSVDSMLLEPL